MKRVSTKIGDIFSVKIGNVSKCFQYIANDSTQLNSDVIRGFKTEYPVDVIPDIIKVVESEVEFYAHCNIKLGVKIGMWEKIGNISNIGNLSDILFRDTNDCVRRADEEPIKISNKWYVWRINDKEFTRIGKLEGKYKKADVGFVINPKGILELIKGNKYPPEYPD